MSFLSQLNDQQRAEVEAHYAERYAADRNSQLSTTQQQLHAAQQQAAIQLQHMQQLQKQLDEYKQSIEFRLRSLGERSTRQRQPRKCEVRHLDTPRQASSGLRADTTARAEGGGDTGQVWS